MIKIYDDEPIKSAIERTQLPNGIYIDVDLRDSNEVSSGVILKRRGLDIGLEELRFFKGFPIVLYSTSENATSLFLDGKFMTLMTHPWVYFLRDVFILDKVEAYLSLPAYWNDALGLAAKYEERSERLNRLRNEYPKNPKGIIERARGELNLSCSDEELADLLKYYTKELPPFEHNGRMKDVFCDVDCLWRNGRIDKNMLGWLIEYSKYRAVNLWTDRNVCEIVSEIGLEFESQVEYFNHNNGISTNLHLRTPVLNKKIFKNSKPEVVIDKLSRTEIEEQFKIRPTHYIQIR